MRLHAWICALLLTALSATSYALGPLDDETGLRWWADDFDTDAFDTGIEAGAFGGIGGDWWSQRWGLRGGMYRSQLDELDRDGVEYLSLDLKRRVFSSGDSTFFAVGLGWEDVDLGQGVESQGPRFALDGRAGLFGVLSVYGQAAWFPSMDDASGFEDIQGNEFEAGISYDPAPFVSLRAGFRQITLDFNDPNGLNSSSESRGFVLGGGIHW